MGSFSCSKRSAMALRLTWSAMSSRRLTSSQWSMTWPFFSSRETPLANSSHCRTISPASSAETGGGVTILYITSSVRALEEAMAGDKKIFLATQQDASIDEPKPNEIYSVGTIVNIVQSLKLPDG